MIISPQDLNKLVGVLEKNQTILNNLGRAARSAATTIREHGKLIHDLERRLSIVQYMTEALEIVNRLANMSHLVYGIEDDETRARFQSVLATSQSLLYKVELTKKESNN